MKRILLALSLLLPLLSCRKEEGPVRDRLVVEGWIDSGGNPRVMVTSSFTPGADSVSLKDLYDHVLRWCKVTLSDGEKETVLTGMYSRDPFPSYIYSTGRMRGEVGKTYTLQVDADGRSASARTTIPPPCRLESLESVSFDGSDSLFLIRARFRWDPERQERYKFFVRIENADSSYVAASMSLSGTVAPDGMTEVTIRPGYSLFRRKRLAFASGERVFIKISTLEEDLYWFWKTYEDQLSLARTPFFSIDRGLLGNVEGALGYFAGYGSTEYEITLP
jgi:hypothetical protein